MFKVLLNIFKKKVFLFILNRLSLKLLSFAEKTNQAETFLKYGLETKSICYTISGQDMILYSSV